MAQWLEYPNIEDVASNPTRIRQLQAGHFLVTQDKEKSLKTGDWEPDKKGQCFFKWWWTLQWWEKSNTIT